jgi:hypothetical protein
MSKTKKAYKQGYDAYYANDHVNPYCESLEAHNAWLEGYEAALDEDTEMEEDE